MGDQVGGVGQVALGLRHRIDAFLKMRDLDTGERNRGRVCDDENFILKTNFQISNHLNEGSTRALTFSTI